MTGTLPPLLDSVVGGGTPEQRVLRVLMGPMLLCPGKGLVLPKTNVDEIAANSRFLLVSLTNDDMSKKSPFAIHKALIGIGGEPKFVKRLRSGDLLIETSSALQTKSFLLAKLFLDCTVTISPHKTLNSSRGVISEPDLLATPEAEILEGFSNQAKCISFYSFRFHIVVYHSGKNILPSASSIKPTTQIESRLPEPISSDAAAPDNTLNTSASSLSAETCPLTTEIQPLVPLPESVPTTSNTEHSNAPEIPVCKTKFKK
ncbi:putative RNA-directed DNA polymerase from transposon BS [Trichonephila clavipes]|nr:putative RNA-directed DNA polymerase from transposon BS [Trichonephila clavipes]